MSRNPPEHSKLAIHDASTFAKWRTDYCEPSANRHYDNAIRRMLKLMHAHPGASILDAGCGTGVHSIRAAKLGMQVVAVDVSPVALQEAEQRAQASGLQRHIAFEQVDITDLPFADESFSLAFSWGVISHVEDIEKALHELARTLKVGGRLALQVPNASSFDFLLERVARALLRKPRAAHAWTHWGFAGWDVDDRGRMWNSWLHVAHLKARLASLGLRPVHRGPSEVTELQRRTTGPLRRLLRIGIELWFVLRLPARVAATNLLIFEKVAKVHAHPR